MSASTFVVNTSPVALSASATKSMWLLSAAQGIRLTEISVSFDASTASTAARVDLYRATTVGSPTGTTGTAVRVNNPFDYNTAVTSLTALTAEPTTVELLRQWYVQPAGGLLVVQFPLGREPAAYVNTARLGLRVVTPSAVSPNALSYVEWEE